MIQKLISIMMIISLALGASITYTGSNTDSSLNLTVTDENIVTSGSNVAFIVEFQTSLAWSSSGDFAMR